MLQIAHFTLYELPGILAILNQTMNQAIAIALDDHGRTGG